MLTLHYAPGTIAIVAALALEEAGLTWSATRVDFGTAEQTKVPYLTLNPKGRVPLLETPQGLLTETGAILDWIADTVPGAHLRPSDPYQTARMREAMYYCAATFHVAHAHKMRGSRWANAQASFADMTAKVPETMAACAAYVEGQYDLSPYVLGDQISLADPYLWQICQWLDGDGVDIAQFPKLARFNDTYGARPAVAALRDRGMI